MAEQVAFPDLILPEHHEAAKAIGAVVGSVVVTKEVWIYPELRNMFPASVYMQTENERKVFCTMDETASYPEGLLEGQARKSAVEVGGKVVGGGCDHHRGWGRKLTPKSDCNWRARTLTGFRKLLALVDMDQKLLSVYPTGRSGQSNNFTAVPLRQK